MATAPYSGNGYWKSQIVICGLGALLGIVGGPIAVVLDKEEPGRGVIYFLIGLLFLPFFISLLRKYLKSSKKQRAAYAWVIMQQNSELQADGLNPGNDAWALHMAEQARTGKITASEVADLQRLRPDVPYPGDTPTRGTRPLRGASTGTDT